MREKKKKKKAVFYLQNLCFLLFLMDNLWVWYSWYLFYLLMTTSLLWILLPCKWQWRSKKCCFLMKKILQKSASLRFLLSAVKKTWLRKNCWVFSMKNVWNTNSECLLKIQYIFLYWSSKYLASFRYHRLCMVVHIIKIFQVSKLC